MAKNYDNWNGTSFYGLIFKSSVNDIKKKFGEPDIHYDNADEKVQNDWRLQTEKGNFFSIYDWKIYEQYSDEEKLFFHVGHFKKDYDDVKDFLTRKGFNVSNK